MRVPLGVAWVTALSGPFADSVCGPWPSKRDKTGAYPRLRGRGMGRFRSVAITVIVLVAALSASDLSGKGKGGGGKRGGGHKPAPHRAAPKVHAGHHSGPKPNRVARKPAPHHGGHPGGKQAHHSAKPKGPVKVSKPDEKRKESPKKDAGKKDPGKKKPGKPPEKPQPKHPDDRSKQQARKPDAKKKESRQGSAARRETSGPRSAFRRSPARGAASFRPLRPPSSLVRVRSALVVQLRRLPELLRRRLGDARRLLRGRRRSRFVGELRGPGAAGRCCGVPSCGILPCCPYAMSSTDVSFEFLVTLRVPPEWSSVPTNLTWCSRA